MNLNEVLNRHTKTLHKDSSYISLTSGSSSAIWPIIEKLTYRELDLLRTIHLELTLEAESSDSVEQFLIDHIDLNLAQLLDSSFTHKYDRSTELGFESRSKMQKLFNLLHKRAYSSLTPPEFHSKYSNWLKENKINDLLTSQSSRDINEIFTFFIIQEQNDDFFQNFRVILENMIDDVYSDYSSRLFQLLGLKEDWNSKAEKIFALMDDEKKGHVEAEGLQLWTLSQTLAKVGSVEPILLRKQTFNDLQELKHANGLVSMRSWKNYLIKKKFLNPAHLDELFRSVFHVKQAWKTAKATVFSSETFVKQQVESKVLEINNLWEQCIACCISVVKNAKESSKLYKFLKFTGLLLGSTPNLATKGVVYLQGTYLRDVGEFSVYLMNNYLQLSGQYHTSASFATLNQQALDSLSSDLRFQVIRKTLQTFDSLMNIILYEVIASFQPEKKPVKEENSVTWQYSSNTSILNGIVRSVSYSKQMETKKNSKTIKNSQVRTSDKSPILKSQVIGKSFKGLKETNDLETTENFKDLRTFTPTRLDKKPDFTSKEGKSNTPRQGKSPLRPTVNRKNDRPKTPTRTTSGNVVEVKAVVTKSPYLTSRTPTRDREKPKETYEQVIKRLINKKL